MLGAGVNLRDVQIAARHADTRTTVWYDRARKNLDAHSAAFSLLRSPPDLSGQVGYSKRCI